VCSSDLLRDLIDLISRRQQPQRVKMALADRIDRRLIARLKLNTAHMRLDRRPEPCPSTEPSRRKLTASIPVVNPRKSQESISRSRYDWLELQKAKFNSSSP